MTKFSLKHLFKNDSGGGGGGAFLANPENASSPKMARILTTPPMK
jgi:hypothetical protein